LIPLSTSKRCSEWPRLPSPSYSLKHAEHFSTPAITKLLIQGDRIQVLKIYREATSTGLRETKDAIEAYEKLLNIGKIKTLEDLGYDLAEQCRDKKISEAQAINEMKLRLPGYSDEKYRSALSQGFFDSR
jgi:hypothetical protein